MSTPRISKGMTGGGRKTVASPRRAAPKRRASTLDRAVNHLPISREALRRAGNWTLGIAIAGAVIGGLIAMNLPQMIGLEIAEGIGRAGFKVRNVEILNRRQVDSGVRL